MTDSTKENISINPEIEKILSKLAAREERVLRMWFGLGNRFYTSEEIAAEFNVTPDRVYQVIRKALSNLSAALED